MLQSPPIVAIDNLTLQFPSFRGVAQALTNVSLHVSPGEVVGLVGESGSGKSVTAMSLLRLMPQGVSRVAGGTVALLGQDVLAMRERDLRNVRGGTAAMVFQEPMTALNPTIRVGLQIADVVQRHQGGRRGAALKAAAALLAEMQVNDPARVMRAYPFELSGGMRQRVMLAMAFSCDPRLLIADEPTTALDVTVQAQVLALIRERIRVRNTAVLFITHDLAVVSQLCDRVYVMYAGRIVESGATADVLQRPAHPYTRALLRCLPEFALPHTPIDVIPGTVPNLMQKDDGCRFRFRCAFAAQRCAEQPPLVQAGDAAQATACWFPQQGPVREAGMDPAPVIGLPGPDLLVLDQVQVRYRTGADWLGRPAATVHALNGVDLVVRAGETLGIVGESGCGKSTLAQVGMGLLAPTDGRVSFCGHDLSRMGRKELRTLRRQFQIVFQDPQSSLNPRMPAWRIMTEPLLAEGRPSRHALRQAAASVAAKVGLRPDQLDRFPHQFSGGQRQRIAIARALTLRPKLLVLDEPTSALDVSVQAQILNLLLELQADLGLAYLLISHNISVVRHIATTVAVMYLGQVMEQGPAADVLNRPSHPYTRLLLAALPSTMGVATVGLPRVAETPSNLVLPSGCFFADRCSLRTDGCGHAQVLRDIGESRQVRCHRVGMLPPGISGI